MNTNQLCPQCQSPLPPDAPEGLCPACLAQAAFATQPEPGATQVTDEPAIKPRRGLPKLGELFGGYRILNELGRGGMGAVFEAEHLESGRRVALKVLGHQLDSPDARARFLREGRLAASINHPNSVYVFGTEEIDGTPAIAMELIAGGTLQERVQVEGPLPVGQAVDAILQVIAGLEAAQAIGILHRDIKPANCFEDADGTVKIGDFGLSISTAARRDTNLTLQGAFLGTPAFCSPEQLRGEELNARSDLYSVGVTLFYLLTGRTPFEAKNMVQLLATVLEQPAPSPKKFRPELPQGLVRAILRCLEKQAGERFANYDELRQALAPFSSAALVPAPLGLRFLAGAVDMLLVCAAGMTVNLLAFGGFMAFMDAATFRSPKVLFWMVTAFVAMLLYYALLEGIRGASLGKAICRLRVVDADRNPPGVWKALVRAVFFVVLPGLPYWVSFGFDPVAFMQTSSNLVRHGVSLLYYVVLGLLFCTARRRNGFAAIQDLLTRTRVIRKPAYQARPVLTANEESPPAAETLPRVGPYHVLETVEKTTGGEWLLGYDTRLLRKVWVRVVPPGTPPVAPPWRHLGRVGRLRWITGRRSPDENWDAFEGATGKPLVNLLGARQPWSQVRYWLLDLANEINAAQKDGTLPAVLALDRVWITADGRAKLLDFPAPGGRRAGPAAQLQPPPALDRSAEVRCFLNGVAVAVLEGRVPHFAEATLAAVKTPLPLHARTFLEKLPTLPGLDAIVAELKPLLHQAAVVSRWRRAAVIGGCAAFPLLAGVGFIFIARVMIQWQRSQPDIMELGQVLQQRSVLRMPWFPNRAAAPDDRTFAIYIASHFGQTITNAGAWSSFYAAATVSGDNRQFAEASVAEHPNPTAAEVAAADKAMKPYLRKEAAFNPTQAAWMPFVVAGMSLLVYVGLPALLAAVLFRGGLVLRLLGLAVVRRDGARASRLRVLWRGVVAWSPALSAPVLAMMLTPLVGAVAAGSLVTVLVIGLAACSLALPERSLQDRLAGTCLVPR
ncbi:MAG: protein kinase [Verrucomicrobia bacterium]|nr:protein kinase [Verrucomicrobiota bacterium]